MSQECLDTLVCLSDLGRVALCKPEEGSNKVKVSTQQTTHAGLRDREVHAQHRVSFTNMIRWSRGESSEEGPQWHEQVEDTQPLGLGLVPQAEIDGTAEIKNSGFPVVDSQVAGVEVVVSQSESVQLVDGGNVGPDELLVPSRKQVIPRKERTLSPLHDGGTNENGWLVPG